MKIAVIYIILIFTLVSCVENLVQSKETEESTEQSVIITFPQNNDTVYPGTNDIVFSLKNISGDPVSTADIYINDELVQSSEAASIKDSSLVVTIPEKFKGTKISLYMKVTLNSGSVFTTETVNDLYVDPLESGILAPTGLEIYEFERGKLYGLIWTLNSGNEEGVEIWRKDLNGSNTYSLYKSLPRQTAYNDTITISDHVYYYKIRVYRSTVFSAFSNEVNMTLSGTGFPRPTNLRVTSVSQNKVSLAWNDNSINELGFILERKYSGAVYAHQTFIIGPDKETFTDSVNVYRGTEYLYQIRAYSGTDSSDYSNTVTVQTEY